MDSNKQYNLNECPYLHRNRGFILRRIIFPAVCTTSRHGAAIGFQLRKSIWCAHVCVRTIIHLTVTAKCIESQCIWRHQVEKFSALLALCAGNSPVTDEFPAQRPMTGSFDAFFHLRLNKRLSKQSWGRWLETSLRSLWRHCNGLYKLNQCWPIIGEVFSYSSVGNFLGNARDISLKITNFIVQPHLPRAIS